MLAVGLFGTGGQFVGTTAGVVIMPPFPWRGIHACWVRRGRCSGCLWSNKAVRCRHLFWTVMAFILDSVGGRHRCDMRAPVPLVS